MPPYLVGFVRAFHPAAPGLTPKHAIYAFIIYSQMCAISVLHGKKRTKIKKKRPVLAHLKKFPTKVTSNCGGCRVVARLCPIGVLICEVIKYSNSSKGRDCGTVHRAVASLTRDSRFIKVDLTVVEKKTCGQSYKASTIVIYDSRVCRL